LKKGWASDIQIDAMELLKSIMSQLGIDHTFFMQLVLVLVCYFFLSRFLFKPVLTILLLRAHRVDGVRRSADTMLFEHDKMIVNYKTKWREYELRAVEVSHKIVSEARSEAVKIIDDAESKANEYLKNKRQDIEKEAKKLSIELGHTSSEVEALIVTKLLGA